MYIHICSGGDAGGGSGDAGGDGDYINVESAINTHTIDGDYIDVESAINTHTRRMHPYTSKHILASSSDLKAC